MNNFEDKVVVVTGGSRGIGRATAEAFVARGAKVAVICSGRNASEEYAKSLASDIASSQGADAERVSVYFCNVADSSQTKDTVRRILADLGTVDVLVNNAGITKDKLLLSMKEEDFDSVIAVNLKGTYNMIHELYSVFAKKRSGSIINVSSVSGFIGTAGQANYAASKAGVAALTKTVAHELGGRGVRCNAVAPGYISTDMTAAISEETQQEYLKQIPLKRYGVASDVANAIVFLASEQASYITGQIIRIDGGMLM